MTVFTPDWKLTVSGVDYTDIAISDVQHQAGRIDIYQQPLPSYIQITLVALSGQILPFDINDDLSLQVKDSSGSYVTLFGGDVTDVTVEVGATGSLATVVQYTLIAMGSLARLAKEIYNGTLNQDEDGEQIYTLLSSVFAGTWNDVPAAATWSAYDATETWTNAQVNTGDIDRPGLYTMENRGSTPDTIYNIASLIANSAFGYLFEQNNGFVGYADADHRQSYLALNGYIDIDGGYAIGQGLSTVTRSSNVRNDIYLNYGNNFGSQVTATDLTSIQNYGYKSESINSVLHSAVDAQDVADRYILQRAYPEPAFQSITFPITNPEIGDITRDALLDIFVGMPINITNLPIQITGGAFQGYVEGWSWSTRFNELFLTINLSPTAFSQTFTQWVGVDAAETWNTLSNSLTWEYATIVA